MPKPMRLPSHLPPGSKYVIESHRRKEGCTLMHRYVELPDGQRVVLRPRLIPIGGRTATKSGSCTRGKAARR